MLMMHGLGRLGDVAPQGSCSSTVAALCRRCAFAALVACVVLRSCADGARLKVWWHRRHIGRALLEVIKTAVASFLLLQQCKNGVCSHFCFSNYLTSSLDREGAPGGPAGFTYRQGRGRLPLLHSRGVWGERASVPPGKDFQPTGLASRR